MKKIEIIQDNYRVLTALKDEILIGRIVYLKWYSANKAAIMVGENSEYSLEPKGFWQTKLELLKDNAVILNIKSKFTGYEISRPTDPDRPYSFKYKGFFKKGYVLVNYKDEVLLEIVSNFSWKKRYPGYTAACSDDFREDEFEKILLMLCVHLCRTLYNAAAASAT